VTPANIQGLAGQKTQLISPANPDMTAAQAQAQALAAATEVQSLQVVKALVKLAVHQLCALRSLFPDKAFNSRSMAGLDNMHELKARAASRRSNSERQRHRATDASSFEGPARSSLLFPT
jgi:hypothetical protein